jgi:hypothetical protein
MPRGGGAEQHGAVLHSRSPWRRDSARPMVAAADRQAAPRTKNPKYQWEARSIIAAANKTSVKPAYSHVFMASANLILYSISAVILARTSSSTTAGAAPLISALRAAQEIERTWSASTTPVTGYPAGIMTSKGWPFT